MVSGALEAGQSPKRLRAEKAGRRMAVNRSEGRSTEDWGQTAYRWVLEADRKMTVSDLAARLASGFDRPRRETRRWIRILVEQGRLTYVYQYGQSYVDLGFQRPTAITPGIRLCPPGCAPSPDGRTMTVVLEPGAAFGDGRHPTTRLAVAGLEFLRYPEADAGPRQRGIDIGTGSGILAIVAARLGVALVDAVDIDPCAMSEAKRNIDHNRLGRRIRLRREALESLETRYDLIMANLRLPTLGALAPWIESHIRPHAHLVFSGFRARELPALRRAYPEGRYQSQWSRTQADWGAIVLRCR